MPQKIPQIAGALNRAGLLTGSGNRSAKERVTQAAEAMQFKAKHPADEQAAAGDDLNRTVPNLSSIVFLAKEKKAKVDPTRILFTGMPAQETKNLARRKSDVQESQWLMKLHTYWLLRNSFRPVQEIRTMRTYWRQRNDLVRSARRHI